MRAPTEPPPADGRPSDPGTASGGSRSRRLAEALRANLARRKAQKRARDAAGQGGDNENKG
jgi:hypothetical protein